ncbi:DUF456 domain-containing protein [Halobacteriaceae archaeon GCM10025711]
MVDLVVLLAVALLVLGVVGSVVPLLPGAPLSLAGVYLYWWHTGFTDPGVVAVVGFTLVGGFATVMDYFGGPIGASAGGASLLTSVLAGLVGVVLLFTLGPVAMVVGIPVAVFLLEFRRHDDVETGSGPRSTRPSASWRPP